MKKIIKFVVIGIITMFGFSCKKNYTCTCTTTDTNFSPPAVFVTTSTAKSTETDAKAWCVAIESTNNSNNKKFVPGQSTSCSI